MTQIIDKYSQELSLQVASFEKQNGDLQETVLKHFFVNNHSLIMEDDVFFDPDLVGLKKYENWLNGGN